MWNREGYHIDCMDSSQLSRENRVVPIQWQQREHVRRRSDPLEQFLGSSRPEEKLIEVYDNLQTGLSRVSETPGMKHRVSFPGTEP